MHIQRWWIAILDKNFLFINEVGTFLASLCNLSGPQTSKLLFEGSGLLLRLQLDLSCGLGQGLVVMVPLDENPPKKEAQNVCLCADGAFSAWSICQWQDEKSEDGK